MIGENNPNFKNKYLREFTCIVCNTTFERKTYGVIKTCSNECLLKNISKTHKGKIIFNKIL